MRARVRVFQVEVETTFPTIEEAKASVYNNIVKPQGAVILFKRHGGMLWYEDNDTLYTIKPEPDTEPFPKEETK